MDNYAEQLNCNVIRLLAELRIKKGLSHQEIANRTGLNRSYIGLLERNLRRPTLEVSARIAQALDVPLSRIIAQAEKLSAVRKK